MKFDNRGCSFYRNGGNESNGKIYKRFTKKRTDKKKRETSEIASALSTQFL